jgi:hypothetical protein
MGSVPLPAMETVMLKPDKEEDAEAAAAPKRARKKS